jgi:transcriptional regulator with XRE-family HTH domain
MSLSAVLTDLGLSQRDAARALGVSQPTVNRIVGGRWPAKGAAQVRRAMDTLLRSKGASPTQLLALYAAPASKEVGPDVVEHVEADPPVTQVTEPQGEEPMLLQNAALTPEARAHFALPRNPFQDDVQSSDDVFQTASVRYVRASLLDCRAAPRLCGHRGRERRRQVHPGRRPGRAHPRRRPRHRGHAPLRAGHGENDNKGKTLKSGQIAEAVIRALDPQAPVRSSPRRASSRCTSCCAPAPAPAGATCC